MIQEILQTNNKGIGKDTFVPGVQFMDAMIKHDTPLHHSYKPLAQQLYENFPEAKNILEVGCGGGNLAFFYKNFNPKATYVTLDINNQIVPEGLVSPDFHFTVWTDQPYQITKDGKNIKFDLVVSYEHFEHIKTENIKPFLLNIKNHIHKNSTVVATASLISPGSHPHLTVWRKEKWEEILVDNGFKMLPKQILTPESTPGNFSFINSTELIFTLK